MHLDLPRASIVVISACLRYLLYSFPLRFPGNKIQSGIEHLDMICVVFACSSRRTWTERCKWVVFYFLFSNRELPKCFCLWMEQSAVALKRIILYLAVICQSKFHTRSRCTFWVTAISMHLGSYLLIIGRIGSGGWWRKENLGLAPSSVYFLNKDGSQRKTFSVWTLKWIFCI